MQPPNQTYKISPITHQPEEMRYDLAILPAGLVCPNCGSGLFVRLGSDHFPGAGNVRCQQCGCVFELA